MYKWFGVVMLAFSTQILADDQMVFSQWIETLKYDATQQNISKETVDQVLNQAQILPNVITLDRTQPEFISPFLTYLDKRVTRENVVYGRQMLGKYVVLLNDLEHQYKIPKTILVAFWALETNFGRNKGHYSLASALLTLAYEGRRAAFFRSELINCMRIVDAGHINAQQLVGSWAGASGHMQFMPSTFLKYGVDTDLDGHIDIWDSIPDAFGSAANYLSVIGWRPNEPVAVEVQLPAQFNYQLAQLELRNNSQAWMDLGIQSADGQPIPALENSAIILPQGWQGPAFLVGNNFNVIMHWNRSINYALAVSYLADQLYANKPIIAGLNAPKGAVSFNQIWALQAKLNELGYDSGDPDGFPGLKTQAAIRQYQATQNLPQDGYASPDLYQQLIQP